MQSGGRKVWSHHDRGRNHMTRNCVDEKRLRQWALNCGFRVAPLAKELGISQRHLQRYTCLLFGRSPQDWLNDWRLILAAQMLKENRSVKWVALDLGYKQVSHFSREFKRFHKLSPTMFLARLDHSRQPSLPAPHWTRWTRTGPPFRKISKMSVPDNKCPPQITLLNC